MSSTTDVEKILRDACRRSAVIELHRQDGRVAIPAARARMLALTEDGLYLDKPQTIGQSAHLSKGHIIEAFFQNGDDLYTFVVSVLQHNCKLKLNAEKTVVGMKIARPGSIKQGQRRQYFRTSLALQDPIPFTLHRTDPSKPLQTPVTAHHFKGLLLDGSSGGFGVRIDGVSPGRFTLFDHYFISFTIPGQDAPSVFLTELRQTREIRQGDSIKLGLQALNWPNLRELERTMQPFTQHLNSVQRLAKRAG